MPNFSAAGEYGSSGWSQGSRAEQREQYKTLLRCDYTARFLNYKFRNAKVFGIEGCDSLLPGKKEKILFILTRFYSIYSMSYYIYSTKLHFT